MLVVIERVIACICSWMTLWNVLTKPSPPIILYAQEMLSLVYAISCPWNVKSVFVYFPTFLISHHWVSPMWALCKYFVVSQLKEEYNRWEFIVSLNGSYYVHFFKPLRSKILDWRKMRLVQALAFVWIYMMSTVEETKVRKNQDS